MGIFFAVLCSIVGALAVGLAIFYGFQIVKLSLLNKRADRLLTSNDDVSKTVRSLTELHRRQNVRGTGHFKERLDRRHYRLVKDKDLRDLLHSRSKQV